jgi:hypothetical protein
MINLTDWIPNSNPDFHTIDNTMGSSPHGIFFLHNILYWTEIRLLSIDDTANITVLRKGALYALNLESNITRRLVSNSTISPQDLSSFSDMPGLLHYHNTTRILLFTTKILPEYYW